MKDDLAAALTRRRVLAAGGLTLGGVTLGSNALAQTEDGDSDSESETNDSDSESESETYHYRVTVANNTRGQPFTPPAVAAHQASVEVFSVGDRANEATQQIAENGNLGPLLDLIANTDAIRDAAVGDSPLVPQDDPADTGNPYYTTLTLSADASAKFLTFVSMLVATNDGIVGLDTVPLPQNVNESRTYFANGYDVGTEQNTETFADLVPPAKTLIQGGEPEGTDQSNPEIAEDGVITPHPGIQGVGDLSPDVYDWSEPAALVQVERVASLQSEFTTDLSGDSEVPPVETEATGTASFSLNEAGDELGFEVSVQNIENAVAAHIHCAPVVSNGPVGVTLYNGDPVSSDGVLAEGAITAPDEDNGCGWQSFEDVLDALRSGHTYVNVHTEANPAGEIRGQIY